MSEAPVLEARHLVKRFGALAVTNGVSFKLGAGERRAIIGPNGAGKTTLFNLLTGELAPDAGAVLISGRDATRLAPNARARLGLGRSFQKNNLFTDLSARENLTLAAETSTRRSGTFWRNPANDRAIVERIGQAAASVGINSTDLNRPVEALSYGVRRQLEVAIALATAPKLLLLDEPTSGMSPEETGQMLALIRGLPRTLSMLIIEHDMDLVFSVADSVTVLSYGEVVFDGTPDQVRASAEVKRIYFGQWGKPHA